MLKIAVFTKNRSNPAYAAARLGADRAAARFGALTRHYVPSKPDDVDEQIALIGQALAEKPDGFVVVPVHPTAINAALCRIYASGIPLVGCINRFSEPGPVCYVGSDDYAIGRTLANYLCRHLAGRSRLVIVEGAPASPTSIERVRGFADALKNFPGVRLVRKIRGDYLREPAQRAARELLKEGVTFDAVLAANDEMALGVIAALEAAGAHAVVASVNAIPEAVSAIREGKLLATVDFSAKDIATIAAEALLRHLRGESVPGEIMLPVQLVDSSNRRQWDKPFELRPDVEWLPANASSHAPRRS
jgi:ribose transport system substrate-binding protein